MFSMSPACRAAVLIAALFDAHDAAMPPLLPLMPSFALMIAPVLRYDVYARANHVDGTANVCCLTPMRRVAPIVITRHDMRVTRARHARPAHKISWSHYLLKVLREPFTRLV